MYTRVSYFASFSILTIDFEKMYAILLQSIGVSTDRFSVPCTENVLFA